jgi:sterol desaturase/sphingolipid hydroxylase (fatty acid hydroxylase superfamily)
VIFASANAISTLYQFWIHTELVGKLGWFEEWLNTPSHHRVHHAINLKYLDKNYGAILIVWDRLFGTFEREEEAPVYGIIKPFHSYNPVWAQIEPVLALVAKSAGAPRLGDKLRVWFASPSFTPAGLPPYPGLEDGSYVHRAKYDPKARPAVLAYVMVHFTIVVAITATLMFEQETAPRPLLAVGVVLVLVTLGTMAGIFEGRRWARPVEAVRLVGLVGLLGAWKLVS